MAGAGKRYALARLLESQPKSMRRDPRFGELSILLGGSEALRRYRLSPVAYRLLNEPRLKTAFIGNFRSTYRFPKGPFLELFLAMKWDYRASRERLRRQREARIEALMAACPPEALTGLLYLREAEKCVNSTAPGWKNGPYPRTQKRAREMAGIGLKRWLSLLAGHTEALRGRYRSIALPPTPAILACSILGSSPDPRSGRLPRKAELRSNFKRLCKAHHPDLGGDPERFMLAKKACDYLIGE
jgi:hypothetical protein